MQTAGNNNDTLLPPPYSNTTAPATHDDSGEPQTGFPGARIFAATAATMYGVLLLVMLFLFVRKLRQVCALVRKEEDEQRLLTNNNSEREHLHRAGGHDAHDEGHSDGRFGLGGPIGVGHAGHQDGYRPINSYQPGGRNITDRDKQMQSGLAARSKKGNPNDPSAPFAHHRPSFPEGQNGAGATGGYGNTSNNNHGNVDTRSSNGTHVNDITRTSTIGSGLDYYGNNPGVAPSEVIVEVRSQTGSDDDLMNGNSAGGGGSGAPYYTTSERGASNKFTPRRQYGNARNACTACLFNHIIYPVGRIFTHCCCMPAGYFAQRHQSTLLLLGSLFFYSVARCGELIANTVNYWGANQSAASLYQTVITSFPACCLLLLQLAFNLKWVVNVRIISASGAPEGSRLSLGPSRSALSVTAARRRSSGIPPDEDDPDTPCSFDIGTLSLTMGVTFLIIAPIISFFGLFAWLAKPTDAAAPQDDELNYFWGLQDIVWMKIVTGVFAVPYALNGISCILIGFVLRTVWKPFSEVAVRASKHMFIVALLWGGLSFVRGILLLSYDLKGLNHATQSPWAGPTVLVGEGFFIFLIVFIFYLASRNQDQVVAAEKEARKRLERGGGGGNNSGERGSSSLPPGTSAKDRVRNAAKGLKRAGESSDQISSGNTVNGEEDDYDDYGSNNNNNNSNGRKKGKIGGGGSKGDLLLDENDNNGNNRVQHLGDRAKRKPKGVEGQNLSGQVGGAGGGEHLGGLPVYSTWSSHSQTPSRAVSENFDGGYQQHHHHNQHHQQHANNNNNNNNRWAGDDESTRASLVGNNPMAPGSGQPTQSRLFYEDQ